jgi:hypothetical protein
MGSGKFVIIDLENLPYEIYSSVTKEDRQRSITLHCGLFM